MPLNVVERQIQLWNKLKEIYDEVGPIPPLKVLAISEYLLGSTKKKAKEYLSVLDRGVYNMAAREKLYLKQTAGGVVPEKIKGVEFYESFK
jgi:hypothetical protein